MIKAMILAAGRGERMGQLTKNSPKPMLLVHGQPLIVHHIKKIAALGIKDCLINLYYLAEKISDQLGDGHQFGLRLHYSYEKEKVETAGGIIQALDFFENQPFILTSCDIFTDYPLGRLVALAQTGFSSLAHIVMVDNPAHHAKGDFAVQTNGNISLEGEKLNYAGIGLYHPELFSHYVPGYRKLADVMKDGITQKKITGEHYMGRWINVDTPERLKLAQEFQKDTSHTCRK